MHDETSTGGASPSQAPTLDLSPESVPEAPRIQHVYDRRTGKPIPVALAEKRAARARELNTKTQSRRRARLRAEAADDPFDIHAPENADLRVVLASLDMGGCFLSLAEMQAEAVAMRVWLATNGPRQRQIRSRARWLLAARIALLNWRRETWSDPEPVEFAPRLAQAVREVVDRDVARDTLRSLRRLEAEGGPWEGAAS